jgi:hypothetical protein
MAVVKNRPIVAVLRAMEVGGKEIYPLNQRDSLNAAQGSALRLDRAKGRKWSIKSDVMDGMPVVVVTRIA